MIWLKNLFKKKRFETELKYFRKGDFVIFTLPEDSTEVDVFRFANTYNDLKKKNRNFMVLNRPVKIQIIRKVKL